MNRISMGYFSNRQRYTKTHLVRNGKPICNSQIGLNMTYQFCATSICLDFDPECLDQLECESCKALFRLWRAAYSTKRFTNSRECGTMGL